MTEETEVGHLEEASYAAEYKKQATWIAGQVDAMYLPSVLRTSNNIQ